MNESSPRWPGTDGSPGLDFSPRPHESDAGSGQGGPDGHLNGSQGEVRNGRTGSTDSGAASGSSGRPTPPPTSNSPSQPQGQASSQGNAAASVQTPSRSGAAPAGPGADGAASGAGGGGASAVSGAGAAAAPAAAGPAKPAHDPKVQESAASWAWQPLGAEPDAQPTSRSAASADPATTVRPVAGATAAAAGAGISGAAAKAADQGRKATSSRRTTPSPATSTPSAATRRTGTRRTRKARLRLARLDPWSVMKTTFLFSIAFGIILMVIAWVLWTVLAGSGALDSLNQFMTTLIGQEGEQFNIENYINAPRVLGAAAVLAAIDIVILTAVATLFAFLYNLAATVIGGLEVTLAED